MPHQKNCRNYILKKKKKKKKEDNSNKSYSRMLEKILKTHKNSRLRVFGKPQGYITVEMRKEITKQDYSHQF